jgi:hypothetical protein
LPKFDSACDENRDLSGGVHHNGVTKRSAISGLVFVFAMKNFVVRAVPLEGGRMLSAVRIVERIDGQFSVTKIEKIK